MSDEKPTRRVRVYACRGCENITPVGKPRADDDGLRLSQCQKCGTYENASWVKTWLESPAIL